jgi:hypothetical protein
VISETDIMEVLDSSQGDAGFDIRVSMFRDFMLTATEGREQEKRQAMHPTGIGK